MRIFETFLSVLVLVLGNTAAAFAGPAEERRFPELPDKSLSVQRPAGLPQTDPFDPHRMRMNGELFFPLGFYGGSMTMTSDDSAWGGDPETAFGYFLAVLHAHGLNYFRAWTHWGASRSQAEKKPSDWDYHMVHPYLRSKQCCANDGGNKFDLDSFNPAYFDSLVRLMESARAKGLVGQILLFDCWHAHNDGDTLSANITHDYYYGDNNVNGADARNGAEWTAGNLCHPLERVKRVAQEQRDLVLEVLAHLEGFDNIVWETCNENRDNPAFHQFVYDVIRSVDSRHLVMPIDLPEHRDVAGHRTPAPTNAESIESMHNRLSGQQFAWNQPLVTDNDCCDEPGGINAAFRRKKAWAALTAGAHTDYFINNMPAHQHLMDDPDITLSMVQFSHILDVLHTLRPNLLGAVPSDDKVSGTSNWAFGRPGEEYVVYLPQGGSVTVQDLPAKYIATWINPRNNAWTQELRTASSGPLHAPDSQDWGLHIRCGHGGYQAPYTDSVTVPGRIEAEGFDCGGEGVAYHDSDRGNNGGAFRFSDVDLQASTDGGGGHQVGWIKSGEWLEYQTQVAASGTYQPLVRVSGPGTGGSIRFRFELGGNPLGGTITTAPTGSFTTWKTVTGPELPVGFGPWELRLVAVSGGFNLNWIDFDAAKSLPAGAFIADRFTNTSAAREVGDPLNGTSTQIGNRTWTATSGFGFGSGALTNLTTAASHVAGIPFGSTVFTQRTATVEALLDSTRSDWIGIGFSRSATGGYWSHGQVWAFLRYDGALVVNANGTAHKLYVGLPAAYVANAPNRLRLEYDRIANSARLWLNGVQIPLTTPDLDTFGFVPNITHVGVHAYKTGGFEAASRLFVDDFRVDQAGTVSPQTVTVACNADAYVAQELASNNYGGSTLLPARDHATGRGRRFFLRFQVPSISGTIVSAKLRLRTRSTLVTDASVYRMNDMTWSEYGITWANHLSPPTTFTYLRSGTNLAPNTFHEIDVTEAVSGAGTVNLCVTTNQDLSGQSFYSRETTYKPTLVITYLP